MLVHAQSAQAVLPLAQNVQAVPGLVHSPLGSAQNVHGVLHGVHRIAQISQSAYAQICQIWISTSWMKWLSLYVGLFHVNRPLL